MSSNLNIVIPMAGAGSRFSVAGYATPKPLITIHGSPMIRVVIENLRPADRNHRFIFICQSVHARLYDLRKKLESWAPGCALIELEGLTDGAARTVLAAQALIDNDDELMIANSDQYIDVDINQYLAQSRRAILDGLVMTMKADDPKWSFVGLSDSGLVEKIIEKQVISDEATVGIYNFMHGSDFVRAARSMIDQELRVNGEFYVAPVYNQLISEGKRIGIYNIGREHSGMHGLGTPSDLEKFISSAISHTATDFAS